MKRILFLLLPALWFSQDLKYAEQWNELDTLKAKEIANEIMSFRKQPVTLFRKVINEDDRVVRYIYYPNNLSKKEIQEDWKSWGYSCQQCETVDFRYYFRGRDNDLEIPGIFTLNFSYVSGSYLELYPWWEKHFAPGISKEDLIDKKHNDRYIRSYKPDIDIRFTKQLDSWDIKNVH